MVSKKQKERDVQKELKKIQRSRAYMRKLLKDMHEKRESYRIMNDILLALEEENEEELIEW